MDKYKPSTNGHQYAITVIDLLTIYVWCIPITMKEADKVMHA